MSEQTAKRIPYDSADYGRMRQDNSYYAHDPRLQRVVEQVTLKKLFLVYRGWELVYREEATTA